MQIQISLSSARFMYGMRIRPFSIGTQPAGQIEFIPHDAAPAEVKRIFEERDYRYGVLIYPSKLSARDIDHYDLTDLNSLTDAEKWDAFVNFCRDMRGYNISFKELVDDYIKPGSDYYDNNPLHKEKPAMLFHLLQQHHFRGTLQGLEDFYEGL